MLRSSQSESAPIGEGPGKGGVVANATRWSSSTEKSDEEIIQEVVKNLRTWAVANRKDAKRDRFSYWALKIPAFALAAGTSAFETLGVHSAVIVMGVISAMCVAIDAAYPRGLLYNIHRQASNETFCWRQRLKWSGIRQLFNFAG
jgi:hypothetical protein